MEKGEACRTYRGRVKVEIGDAIAVELCIVRAQDPLDLAKIGLEGRAERHVVGPAITFAIKLVVPGPLVPLAHASDPQGEIVRQGHVDVARQLVPVKRPKFGTDGA
ncbi:hypothetical protein D5I55_04705 [Chakrabartia godavariana]|nr:hypothetical protein D5I55_04705 [Chakrabartia godavariana]